MATLQELAAARAGRASEPGATPEASPDSGAEQLPAAEPTGIVDLGEYEPGDDDPEMVPVHIAWLRVRRDIRAIGKAEKYDHSGTRFNFRGVDTVVNFFGPVTLKHGVNILPVKTTAVYSDKTAKSGSKMRECAVTVTWEVMGPCGDTLTLQTMGEALDLADKATTKAQSVALRTLLLNTGLTPTSDPDPDSSYIERGESTRSAESYRDELVKPSTTYLRTQQIGTEVSNAGMLNERVMNEVGEMETLNDLGMRLLAERGRGGAQ